MKNLKKSLISTLKEIKENLGWNYDDNVREIQNLCIDYQNETQDRKLEDAFDEFLDEETCEMYVKEQLESGWLARLPYLVGDTDFIHYDYYRLNAYWNLENIDKDDVECLIDELIDRLEE